MDGHATPYTQLKALTATLCSNACPGELLAAAREMHALCSKLTELDDNECSGAMAEDTFLETGRAINARDAARCMREYMRTRQFIRGMVAAIDTARRRFPGNVIDVLYAGCGPFATLALPVCTQLDEGAQVRFTVIDIHQHSLDSVKALVGELGLERHIDSYYHGDACTYQPPRDKKFHILASETMQQMLGNEPQFAITAKLVPYLHPGGILVPERITVSCCLCAGAQETRIMEGGSPSRVRKEEHMLLVLDKDTATTLYAQRQQYRMNDKPALAPVDVRFGAQDDLVKDVMLSTHIKVFSDIELDDYQCSLTTPYILFDQGKLKQDEPLQFQYQVSTLPAFYYQRGDGAFTRIGPRQ